MQLYYFTAGVEADELSDLEGRLRDKFPDVLTLTKLEEVTRRLRDPTASAQSSDRAFIVFPIPNASSSIDRLVKIAEQTRPGIFFIFVSPDISANDYKRLVRSGGADWVSLQG